MGGNERRTFRDLVADIEARLDPATAEALTVRADEFIAPLGEFSWARSALEGVAA